jgi:hypothetical protein
VTKISHEFNSGEKELSKLVGGGNDFFGLRLRIDRYSPQNGGLDQLLVL